MTGETISIHGILSVHGQGLVWIEGASMLSICRAEFAALLRLCLAARLPVSLGGLAKCLKLHLNALCSVLIRTRADSHSPLSRFFGGHMGFYIMFWYHFGFPAPAFLLLPEMELNTRPSPLLSHSDSAPPPLQTNGSQQRYQGMSAWMLKRGACTDIDRDKSKEILTSSLMQ